MRDKGWRRDQDRRLQSKRLRFLTSTWWPNDADKINKRHLGRLKSSHFGCGCTCCKPWKHKLESKYKVSELRRLQPLTNDIYD